MANHFSCLELNGENFREININESFPNELVMAISKDVMPWYSDLANYIVYDILFKKVTSYQWKQFFHYVK